MASLHHLLTGYICFLQFVYGQDLDLTILVAEWIPGQVFHVDVSNGTWKRVPISNVTRPVAVDYDPQTSDIYWADVILKRISAVNLLGTNERKILSLNASAVPDGLAIDATNRKLFYTDTGYDVIVSMDMDGTNRDVIIDTGLAEPRAIVLHEEIRTFYYTDWGFRPFIATADYEGGNRTNIVTSGLKWPNGLALDKQSNILYWCDAGTHNIESVNVDGTQRRVIIHEPTAHYFDIAFYNGTLYFTDWRRRAVLIMPANGGNITNISSTSINQLAGIHVFSSHNVSKCPTNNYGSPCVPCGLCANDDVCNPFSGFCPRGCLTGWTGERCDIDSIDASCDRGNEECACGCQKN